MRLGTAGAWFFLSALLIGCGDDVSVSDGDTDGDTDTDTDAGPQARLFVAQTPDAWLAGPSNMPVPGHGDDTEVEALRPVLSAQLSPVANLQQQRGELLYTLTQSGGLTVSELTDEGLAMRGRMTFGAEVFDVSTVDDKAALVWTHDRPVAGALSRLEPVDATVPGQLARGTALELPGTIQFSALRADHIVAVLVEDDRGTQAVTTVYTIDVTDPMAPTVVESLELVAAADGASGLRTIEWAFSRIYIATDLPNGSVLDTVEFGGEELALEHLDRIERDEDIVAVGEGPHQIRLVLHDPELEQNTLLSFDRTDFTETDSEELGIGPIPAVSMDIQSVRVLAGSELLEFYDGESGMAATTPIPLTGTPSELRSVGFYQELAIEHLPNPAGGSRIAVTHVDLLQDRVSDSFEIDGDWVHPGVPTRSYASSENPEPAIALPIERTWFLPQGECPDTRTEFGVVLIASVDGELSEASFISTVEEIDSVTAFRAGEESERTHLLVRSRTQELLFDITDPEAPVQLSVIASSVTADKVVVAGGATARLQTDPYGHQILELTPVGTQASGDAIGRLVLADPSDPGWDPCGSISHWTESMLARRDHLFVSRYKVDAATGDGLRSVAIIDISDPTAPVMASEIRILDDGPGRSFGFQGEPTSMAIVGDALVVATTEPADDADTGAGNLSTSNARIYVYDIVDLSNPVLVENFRRTSAVAHGGLTVNGDTITSWAATAANEDASRIHIFAEQLDVSDPAAPVWFELLSVPGVPLAADASGDMLVVDQRVVDASLSEGACVANGYEWDADDEDCDAAHQTLAKIEVGDDGATVIAETTLPGELEAMTFKASPTRIFAVLEEAASPLSVSAVGWSGDVPAVISSVSPPSTAVGPARVFPLDDRAVLTWEGGYGVFDTESLYRGKYDVAARLPTTCDELELVGPSQALCVAGRWGVETLAL